MDFLEEYLGHSEVSDDDANLLREILDDDSSSFFSILETIIFKYRKDNELSYEALKDVGTLLKLYREQINLVLSLSVMGDGDGFCELDVVKPIDDEASVSKSLAGLSCDSGKICLDSVESKSPDIKDGVIVNEFTNELASLCAQSSFDSGVCIEVNVGKCVDNKPLVCEDISLSCDLDISDEEDVEESDVSINVSELVDDEYQRDEIFVDGSKKENIDVAEEPLLKEEEDVVDVEESEYKDDEEENEGLFLVSVGEAVNWYKNTKLEAMRGMNWELSALLTSFYDFLVGRFYGSTEVTPEMRKDIDVVLSDRLNRLLISTVVSDYQDPEGLVLVLREFLEEHVYDKKDKEEKSVCDVNVEEFTQDESEVVTEETKESEDDSELDEEEKVESSEPEDDFELDEEEKVESPESEGDYIEDLKGNQVFTFEIAGDLMNWNLKKFKRSLTIALHPDKFAQSEDRFEAANEAFSLVNSLCDSLTVLEAEDINNFEEIFRVIKTEISTLLEDGIVEVSNFIVLLNTIIGTLNSVLREGNSQRTDNRRPESSEDSSLVELNLLLKPGEKGTLRTENGREYKVGVMSTKALYSVFGDFIGSHILIVGDGNQLIFGNNVKSSVITSGPYSFSGHLAMVGNLVSSKVSLEGIGPLNITSGGCILNSVIVRKFGGDLSVNVGNIRRTTLKIGGVLQLESRDVEYLTVHVSDTGSLDLDLGDVNTLQFVYNYQSGLSQASKEHTVNIGSLKNSLDCKLPANTHLELGEIDERSLITAYSGVIKVTYNGKTYKVGENQKMSNFSLASLEEYNQNQGIFGKIRDRFSK